MARISDYVLDVMIEIAAIQQEGGNIKEDFADTGDFNSLVRRDMLRQQFIETIEKDTLKLLNAFELADITAQQAAKVIYISDVFGLGKQNGKRH